MAFRFRRSIKILPDLRLNLGSRAASVTEGGRGVHVMLQPGHKARATISLRGTGLSYSQGGNVVRPRVRGGQAQPPPDVNWVGCLLAADVLGIILAIKVSNPG